ncbi:MAG: wax ester/triacylglycerol synthase family O-acyltransferase [Pseudomonadaceae bacterium]|nr:wax ester/triacylglycerol synthase family O-acyltransferase [Pseudomonadaceae bacterium]
MNKLAGLDAGFLYMETPRSPTHIASVQMLDLSGQDTDDFVSRVKQQFLHRLDLVPYFTRRLREVPMQLDHPEWEPVEHFDINDHIHTCSVAAPGGRAELEAAVAQVHAQPLDRSKPLWDLWIFTDLANGQAALYNRSHHACIDGVSGQLAVFGMMDTQAVTQDGAKLPESFDRPRKPVTAGNALVGAVENLFTSMIAQGVASIGRTESALRMGQRLLDPARGLGVAWRGAPATRFNCAVSAERTYATGEVSLQMVKDVASRTGGTVNDVFLAICGGGLRRYLNRHGELPEETLLAGCPVSLRKPGDNSLNNQVTMMAVPLATDIASPTERVSAIARGGNAAKSLIADAAEMFEFNPVAPGLPGLMSGAVKLAERTGLVGLPMQRVPFNIVISNVPGPKQTHYMCGAKVLTHYPVSIPAHSQAVNITVQSYDGTLFFAITGCARALPDADRLRDDMLASLQRLIAHTEASSVSVDELGISPQSGPALDASNQPGKAGNDEDNGGAPAEAA